MRPILYIPGCFGSRLNVINNSNKKLQRAWMAQKFIPKVMVGETAINFLWGEQNNGKLISSIEEFGKIEVENSNFGLEGCGYFFDSEILKKTNSMLMAYVGPFYNSINKQLGYQLGKDFFCYPFDWRQSAFCDFTQNGLLQILSEIKEKSNMKPIVILHSGGMNVMLAFMRLQPQWSDLIDSMISINAVIDGAGANSAAVTISGYNMNYNQKVLANVSMKGTESIASNYFNYVSLPTQNYIKKDAITSSVFVKKLDNVEHIREVCSYAGQKFQQQYEHLEQKYIKYELNLNALKGELPNAATILLHKMLKDRKTKYRAGLIKLLSQAIPNEVLGKELVLDFDIKAKKLYCDELLSPDYNSSDAIPNYQELQCKLWHWEEYTPHGLQNEISRDYQHKNKYIEYDDNDGSIQIAGPYQLTIENGFTNDYYSQDGSDIYDIAQARNTYLELKCINTLSQTQVYDEPVNFQAIQNSEMISPQLSLKQGRKMQSKIKIKFNSQQSLVTLEQLGNQVINSPLNSMTLTQKALSNLHFGIKSLPWLLNKRVHKDIIDLYMNLYQPGTLEHKFMAPDLQDYQNFINFVKKPIIQPSKESSFKHYQIVSSGTLTPIHAIYEKPVIDYSELSMQKPTFVYGDGDGLLPLNAAATTVFEKQYIGGVWVISGASHFGAVYDKRVMDIIEKVVKQRQ